MGELSNFVVNFGINLMVAVIIVRFIYYPLKQNKNYVFTFLAFNTVVYFVLTLMASAELSVGVGFGLFAIFSVLRYRTNPMPAREMTYLFVIIAVPVMNSILLSQGRWMEMAAANSAVVVVLYVLEQGWGFHYEQSKRITYEKIELIRPENRPQLIADLTARTGLAITRVETGPINFLQDSAEIKIYYEPGLEGATEQDDMDYIGEMLMAEE